MVTGPAKYRWSSYTCKVGGKKNLIVDFDTSYLALGGSESERQKAYAEYVLETVPEFEIKFIRDSLQRGKLTGSARFREEIFRQLGIRFSNRGPGRPKKQKKKSVPFSTLHYAFLKIISVEV